MKQIPLTQGQFALVDDDDFEYLNKWKWMTLKGHTAFYAIRSVHLGYKDRKRIRTTAHMHRVILGVKDSKILVDHIDHNGLNNQKSNLRTCTHRENSRNRKSTKNSSSKFIGVSWSARNRWRAVIFDGKKVFSLGEFVDEKKAAMAYNNAAKKIFGEFACLNLTE